MTKIVEKAFSAGERSKIPRHFYDASLLFCCMNMLQIDRNKLMRDDPLLFRELQGVCTLCPSKDECALDLSGGFDSVRWDEWWLYCPNSAMLTTIGALQKTRDGSDVSTHPKVRYLTLRYSE